MNRYSARALRQRPTLAIGQADDLKVVEEVNGKHYRVWLCRCGIADGMPYNNAVTIEVLTDTGWKTVTQYAGGPG